MNDSSFIDFLGNSHSRTTVHICLLKTWQECAIKSNPRNSKMKRKENAGKAASRDHPENCEFPRQRVVFPIKRRLDKFVQKTLEVHCFESKAPPSSRSSAQLQEAADAPSGIISPCQEDEAQELNRVSLKFSRYLSTHIDSKQTKPYPSHAQTEHQRGLTRWNTGFHSHIRIRPPRTVRLTTSHLTSELCTFMAAPSSSNATKTQTLSGYLFIYLLDFHSN